MIAIKFVIIINISLLSGSGSSAQGALDATPQPDAHTLPPSRLALSARSDPSDRALQNLIKSTCTLFRDSLYSDNAVTSLPDDPDVAESVIRMHRYMLRGGFWLRKFTTIKQTT